MPQTAGPRRKVLILHIGDHKTGSTSIQLAFAKGLVRIKGHSLCYPAKLASNVLGGQFRAYDKAITPSARTEAAKPFQALAQRIRAADADFTLISAEELEGVSPRLLQKVLSTYFADLADEVRIVAYVRPHAARITSSYAERIKIGIPRVLKNTLEEFGTQRIAAKGFVYTPRFTALRKEFGAQFLLRPMIRDQLHKGSVVEDFVYHAFQGLDYEIAADDAANESLCLEDLMRLKVLHQIVNLPDLRHRLGWEFSRLLGHLPPPPSRTKLKLHKSLADKIHAAYLKDARALDAAFFGGAPLMENELHAAVKTAIPEAQSCDPSAYFSPSEMHTLTLMSHMVAELLKAPSVNWPTFLHEKRLQDVKQGKRKRKAAAQS